MWGLQKNEYSQLWQTLPCPICTSVPCSPVHNLHCLCSWSTSNASVTGMSKPTLDSLVPLSGSPCMDSCHIAIATSWHTCTSVNMYIWLHVPHTQGSLSESAHLHCDVHTIVCKPGSILYAAMPRMHIPILSTYVLTYVKAFLETITCIILRM